MPLMNPKQPEPEAPFAVSSSAEEPAALAADLLFRRHHKDVLRIVRRMLGPNASEHDVEDVAQQTFINAYRSLPKFRGDSKASTWLYRITISTVLMHLRSWKRRKQLLQKFIASWLTEAAPEDPEACVGRRQELAHAWKHLEKLSAKKRVVFVLYEVEGLSCPEIAEVLGVEPGTVNTRLYHARKELVSAMRKERT